MNALIDNALINSWHRRASKVIKSIISKHDKVSLCFDIPICKQVNENVRKIIPPKKLSKFFLHVIGIL